MKRIAILTLFLAVLSLSCSKRWCQSHYPVQSSQDSVYIETVTEKPVYLPGDSIFVEAPVINCPDQSLIKFENSKLKQDISIIKGKLIASTLIKPDTVFVSVVETKTVVKEVKVLDPVKYKPLIYRIAFWAWIFVILVVAGYFALKIFVFKK